MKRSRVPLATGVELDVWTTGDAASPPIIFLHGFPESHRTWRHQLAEFGATHYCIAPDQRGYAGSSKPEAMEAYRVPLLIADVFALADAMGVERFTLVGHDWGGAIAWGVALKDQVRVARLIQCNAAHPFVFQRTLIFDLKQREHSQYMRVFRERDIESEIADKGIGWFFEERFAQHISSGLVDLGDRDAYLAEWSQPGAIRAMLNWYRASPMEVPSMDAPCITTPFLERPFPKLTIPTLVIWGMKDEALLPCQLDGLQDHIEDLSVVRIAEAGHFVPWEAPEAVNSAIRGFLGSN